MSVKAGYGGHYKIGEWLPVQVTLSNTGPSLDVEVQVDALSVGGRPAATYTKRVSLPNPSRKVVTLYTYTTSYEHQISVRLLQAGTVIAEQKSAIDPMADGFLLGVVSDSPELLNGLSGVSLGGSGAGAAVVAHLSPEDLPESAPALGALDGLVFAGTDTGKLSPEARQAVAGWVLNGGALVVAGGPTAQATSSGLADLLPVTITGGGPAGDLGDLGKYAGVTAPQAGNALVSGFSLRPETGAEALAGPAGAPLLAHRVLGSGEVFALALDPSLPPLQTWSHAEDFWRRIFLGHDVVFSEGAQRRNGNYLNPVSAGGYSSAYYALADLSPFDLPSLQLPSIGLVGGFLFLYVLIVGPINYALLRRRRHSELAWLTIPAIILAFVVLAYIVGYNSKGSQVRLTTATVVRTYPGSPVAGVSSFVGLFSPDRHTYNMQFGGDAEVAEVSASGPYNRGVGGGSRPTIYEGRPSSVGDLHVDTWSLRGFMAETTLPYADPYSATLQTDNSYITGVIANQGKTDLQSVAVVYGDEVQIVGTLAHGQVATVRVRDNGAVSSDTNLESVIGRLVPGVPLQSYPPQNSPADRAARRRAALVLSAHTGLRLSQARPNAWVIGWAAGTPLDLSVDGQNPVRDDLVLVTSDIPVGLKGTAPK